MRYDNPARIEIDEELLFDTHKIYKGKFGTLCLFGSINGHMLEKAGIEHGPNGWQYWPDDSSPETAMGVLVVNARLYEGTNLGRARLKLSEQQVAQIRQEYLLGDPKPTMKQLADKYEISQAYVSKIVNFQSRKMI